MPRKRRSKKPRKARKSRKSRKSKKVGRTANERELQLLTKGFVPTETKMGAPFRGKNRIIIA